MDSLFTKTSNLLNDNIDDWFHVYKKFSDLEPCAVKIIDVNSVHLVMEHIDLSNCVNIIDYLTNYDTHVNKVASEYFRLISNIFLFQNNYPFIYFDLHKENMMVNINTGNITLLDPDSFFFYNPSTFYAPGKDKDIDSMRYFEVRLKFQNFTAEIFNSYFTNSKNWSRHRDLVEERNIA
jgi:hypothetical protein|tara:strand:+ start:291 stop:827 length:537 start_codon:yes stop_codon:yes gene_type:complete